MKNDKEKDIRRFIEYCERTIKTDKKIIYKTKIEIKEKYEYIGRHEEDIKNLSRRIKEADIQLGNPDLEFIIEKARSSIEFIKSNLEYCKYDYDAAKKTYESNKREIRKHREVIQDCKKQLLKNKYGNPDLDDIEQEMKRGVEYLALRRAAGDGDLKKVKKLIKKNEKAFKGRAYAWGSGTDVASGAAEEGHLDILKFLHSIGTDFSDGICLGWALRNDHKETAKWLLDKGNEND